MHVEVEVEWVEMARQEVRKQQGRERKINLSVGSRTRTHNLQMLAHELNPCTFDNLLSEMDLK